MTDNLLAPLEFDDVSEPRTPQIYGGHQMPFIVRDYVCAHCWGVLTAERTEDRVNWVIKCNNCGDGVGFVSKYYADKRKQKDYSEYQEVNKLLKYLKIIEDEPSCVIDEESDKRLLDELGF